VKQARSDNSDGERAKQELHDWLPKLVEFKYRVSRSNAAKQRKKAQHFGSPGWCRRHFEMLRPESLLLPPRN
jgi:hypothetical protein